ncbi:hypothetical protein EB093_09995 [bacterium]|nr:hypothetical protein [bacterium]
MYLSGSQYFWNSEWKVDDKPVKQAEVEIGYWRKHPNLHGFIVDTFADGEDVCQRINLTIDDVDKILLAIEDGNLPHTEGFFFGKSELTQEQKAYDRSIFEEARKWLDADPKLHGFSTRSIIYQASW